MIVITTSKRSIRSHDRNYNTSQRHVGIDPVTLQGKSVRIGVLLHYVSEVYNTHPGVGLRQRRQPVLELSYQTQHRT